MLIRCIFSPFSAMKTRSLNHLAILPSNLNLLYASHSNDGTCFLAPTAQPMNFLEGQDFDPTLIRRIFSLFSAMKTRGLNHSAILSSTLNLVYVSHSNDGTCFLVPTAQPMVFLEGQDFNPTTIQRIFSPFSAMKTRGLNHSAILAS